MHIGQLKKGDIGRWLLLDNGETMQLVGMDYGLLHCQATDGKWWIPIHDVVKCISEEEVCRIKEEKKLT